jgi:hypothetical protein
MIKQLIAAFILATGVSYAQDYRTGDADFDASLKLVNTNAKENLSDFKSDLSKRFSVELSKVETCFTSGMNPGDAFMAFQIASVKKIPIENVITVYKTSKSKGWGEMAKELGIKPGSSEFHALKGKAKEKSKGNSGKSATVSKGSTKKVSNKDSAPKSNGNHSGKPNGNSGKGKGKK